MKTEQKIKLFLVDDDELYLKLLEMEFLDLEDITVKTFETGELCVKSLDEKPDLVILDYMLDSINKTAMNGIETLDKIKEFNPAIPVIMLSAQDKIDVAIDCMHHQATDYVVKSETAFLRLKKIIWHTLQYQKIEKQLDWYMKRM